MSEFCEHIEQGLIGWRTISYEESKELHKMKCPMCEAERLKEYNERTFRRFLV